MIEKGRRLIQSAPFLLCVSEASLRGCCSAALCFQIFRADLLCNVLQNLHRILIVHIAVMRDVSILPALIGYGGFLVLRCESCNEYGVKISFCFLDVIYISPPEEEIC